MSFQHEVSLQAVVGTCWEVLQEQLEGTHEEVRSFAVSDGRYGVLITRHRHDAYSLAVSPDVPYGMTYERDDPGTP
ncbi:hypothetical protein [Arthrobacter crystallopoietes]|uniref:hypothetical protein n=1 Tax=Crystallibacter crystallopoietes TaxID=37928 RepID=UPI0011113083|nr:hypothetical protein [Arthrobacter crystallopoietes]